MPSSHPLPDFTDDDLSSSALIVPWPLTGDASSPTNISPIPPILYGYDATEVGEQNLVFRSALAAGLAVDTLHPVSHSSKGKGSDKRLGSRSLRYRERWFLAHPMEETRICIIPDSPHALRRLMVIDLDYRKPGFDPERALVCQAALDNAGIDWLSCPKVCTLTGGLHYYVRISETEPTWRPASPKLDGVDLIADDQHACLPPTPGYEWQYVEKLGTAGIPANHGDDLQTWLSIPVMTRDIWTKLVATLDRKPGARSARRAGQQRTGRNELSTRRLYQICNSTLRAMPDPLTNDRARELALDVWERYLQGMERDFGAPRTDWNITDADFDRAWAKALIIAEQAAQLGVRWEDGIVKMDWQRIRKDGSETGEMQLIDTPISQFARQTAYAGPPTSPPLDAANGVVITYMNGDQVFIPRNTSKNDMEKRLGDANLLDHPNALFKQEPNGHAAWQAFKAFAVSVAQDTPTVQLPTGVWWNHEFRGEMRRMIPDAEWAFYGLPAGPYVPGDRHEARTGFIPLSAEWVSTMNNQARAPWTPPEDARGDDPTTAVLPEFLRTLAGFHYPETASAACALAPYALIRGWLRRVVDQLPMIVIEGTSESGKTKSIFRSVWALAGATPARISPAGTAASMTLSRCGYVVLEDVDIKGKDWQELFRQQQVEQVSSNATGNRAFLACLAIVTEGFPYRSDKAINDRVFHIEVDNSILKRQSLVTPGQLQGKDLHQIANDVCEKHRLAFTYASLQALARCVHPREMVEPIIDWWKATHGTSVRGKEGYAAMEIALRIYCYMARGSQPADEWWSLDFDPTFRLADGSIIDMVDHLRNRYGSTTRAEADQKEASENRLFQAMGFYLRNLGLGGFWDWSRTGAPSKRGGDETTGAWVQDKCVWRNNVGKMCVRQIRLVEWCQLNSRFMPEGTRVNLFSELQFRSVLGPLEKAGDITYSRQFGVRYAVFSTRLTNEFLLAQLQLEVENDEIELFEQDIEGDSDE